MIFPQAIPAHRVQLRRTKGWRKPDNTIVVSRPSKWGNPFMPHGGYSKAEAVADFRAWIESGRSLMRFANRSGQKIDCSYDIPPSIEEIRHELAGKNLACWCKDDVCHATVLLEIANSSPSPANHRRARRNGGGA